MDNRHNYCVILAGGTGSKLWPFSRLEDPKQFHLQGDTGKSFYQHAFERCCGIVPQENIIVVTTLRYQHFIHEQTPQILEENILCEPHHRNTAPAVAFAAYKLLSRDPQAVFAIIPADNIINDLGAFRADLLSAMAFAASNDAIVALGVKPVRPESNYGYIQASGGKEALLRGEPLRVKTFTEKPDPEIARVFIASGEFLWNSGIFALRASVLKEEISQHMPELAAWFGGWEDNLSTATEEEFIQKAYAGIQKSSFDLGVMENTAKAWVYPASFDWADVGSWDSVLTYAEDKDESGNWVSSGVGVVQECRNTLAVTTREGKLVCLKGLENFLVVDTEDILMICPRTDRNSKELRSYTFMQKYEKYK
ncbi:MAG: mannose-1-phosphate guanylyltransferase [Bacteroidales bacterium]|nr:mannose-1-phosphate guanylyltransferase [Bacteroidales bacterium]